METHSEVRSWLKDFLRSLALIAKGRGAEVSEEEISREEEALRSLLKLRKNARVEETLREGS